MGTICTPLVQLMKILLLTNRNKWRSLDKRVKTLQEDFSERLSDIYNEITIDIKHIDTDIPIDKWDNRLDTIWYRKNYILKYKDDYDAIGLVIDRKDWNGQKNLGGFYIINSDTTHSFYIICSERSTTERRGEKLKEFEEYLEHELFGHGISKGLGLKGVNNSDKYVEGMDNTHYFFYKDTKENHYMNILEIWQKKYNGFKAQIQQIKDKLAQIGKKKDSSTKVPVSLLNLLERDFERLKTICDVLYGYNLRITSGFRSFEEQDALYAQGRTKLGKIVTNAKAGQSLHNYGVAFDIVDRKLGYDIEWEKVAHIWDLITDFQGEWGGSWVSFVDKPHFQNTLGHTLKDFQDGKVDYSKFD